MEIAARLCTVMLEWELIASGFVEFLRASWCAFYGNRGVISCNVTRKPPGLKRDFDEAWLMEKVD